LVFSTLHTNSAAQSIDRIIDSCPIEQQAQVRSQLSIVLQAIVSMNLIETSDGTGRTPVVEIMVNSPKIAKHILNGEAKEIQEEKWKLRLVEKDEEIGKYSAELRDQRRTVEGRDQLVGDLEGENTRLKADNERVSREFQQKIAQLNERIKELNQRLVLAEGGPRAAAGQGGFFK